MSLTADFKNLEKPNAKKGPLFFVGLRIDPGERCLLAKDSDGCPAVLMRAQPSTETMSLALSLENLHVREMNCQIENQDGKVIEGYFTILRCTAKEVMLQEYFLGILDSFVLSQLLAATKSDEVQKVVMQLAELFRAIGHPAKRSVIGLWAELFLITQANDPIFWLRAWHARNKDVFDFSHENQRLEVKATSTTNRAHQFSYEQTHPPENIEEAIASVMLQSSPSGKTVHDLWEDVRRIAASDGDLQLKLEQICLEALGEQWNSKRTTAYDMQHAKQSLQFYDARNVPKIDCEIPRGVTQVRFSVDLDHAVPAKMKTAVDGKLFEFASSSF